MTDTFSAEEQLSPEPFSQDALRSELEQFAAQQIQQFANRTPVTELVEARAGFIDTLLQRLWQHFGLDKHNELALIAVGGYGRGELHPLSDVDILLLSDQPLDEPTGKTVSEFLTFLWDLRLEVGHSVRTLDDCIEIGLEDLTVATNLQESRLLCGNPDTFQCLEEQINSGKFWPSEEFYRAKLEEQKVRHARYHDTT
ncbi:nucleotidyltransferase domain-containing protein, partial [Photobacterium sp. OFAV2-7]|uniref:nucleotidyltransferase domain-containing protein n=1 Tax=Photobacterium sp. OFAV2-7 TaxID=2917748 RepID=UPI001EF6D99C